MKNLNKTYSHNLNQITLPYMKNSENVYETIFKKTSSELYKKIRDKTYWSLRERTRNQITGQISDIIHKKITE